MDESLRGRRSALDELRAERGQRQIERARNDADRDYLRQTCVAELNAQPEELIAQEPQLLVGEELVAQETQLLIGEELVAAETTYNEMKARAEAMGPVNMMALEEFQEAEQREVYLRRERDATLWNRSRTPNLRSTNSTKSRGKNSRTHSNSLTNTSRLHFRRFSAAAPAK